MNKKISTKCGITTGIAILSYILLLRVLNVTASSPWVFIQFILLFAGILISAFLLYKYYADIKFLDAFTHTIKTGITALVIVLIGNSILYFIFTKDQPLSAFNFVLMKTIFAFTFSGLLSAFFTSFIFNTFTKKK